MILLNNRVFVKLKALKDRLYYYFAVKNWGVRREYGPYKDSHPDENPWRLRWMLIRLNIHYRVLRRKDYLYWRGGLPYLGGSESKSLGRQTAIAFAQGLLASDVISFDIFDTLILRPFAKPTDLFMLVGKRLGNYSFLNFRIGCEKEAREHAFKNTGSREVTIDDIYERIEKRTGIPKEKGIEAEFSVEMQYCFANPYMRRVFDLLVDQGKTIIIASDMYLPHDRMEKLLKACGYTQYEKLYVSCDYGASKRDGKLYEIIKEAHPGKQILHVGDNYQTDIVSAKQQGLDARYYANCHAAGNKYRADGMSALVGSAYAGIVNTYLHNGIAAYSAQYEYDFIFGGLYVLGFCNWIHSKAKQEGIEKILFLARDGGIYQRVFNELYDDVPNEYLLWSRIANMKATIKTTREEFLRRNVAYRRAKKSPIMLRSLMDALSLGFLEQYFPDYGLERDCKITAENEEAIERLYIEHWSEVEQAYAAGNRQIRDYLSAKIGDAKKVAVIDVGWLGSGPLGLKHLIEEEYGMNCTVSCWEAASCPPAGRNVDTELLDGTLEAYLFSRMDNRGEYDTHFRTNNGANCMIFEMFTQNTMPSFSGFSEDGAYCFDVAEVENYKMIREIHDGIFDFCKLYHNTFRADPYLCNISGHDAYMPFRMAIRDLSYIRNTVGDAVYARDVGGDNHTVLRIKDQIGNTRK